MKKREEKHSLSRRSFLKWSAATASLATGLTACSRGDDESIMYGGGGGPQTAQDKPRALLEGGRWVSVPCPMCLGSRCLNQAYIKDGIPMRMRTHNELGHPNNINYPLYRSCIKGKGMRLGVLNSTRLKYPMKRKSWNPGGGNNVNGHLRGKDEWERISWEEALDIAASEIKRISQAYGTGPGDYGNGLPIINGSYHTENLVLNAAGIGAMPLWGHNSYGGWPGASYSMQGVGGSSSGGTYDRMRLLNNAKLIVLWSANPSWTYPGASRMTYLAAKERGIKIICVDPWLNPGNNAYVDEWIPVRPGTDHALLLGLAHELITNNLVDQNFLDTYTLGFDHLHMPLYDKNGDPMLDENGVSVIENGPWGPGNALSGAHHKDWKNNFKDYVLGTYDNQPKNAEWASAICGTPVALIRSFANDIGTIKPAAFIASNGAGRTAQGGIISQAYWTVGWMTGNLGKPGATVVRNPGFGGSFFRAGSVTTNIQPGLTVPSNPKAVRSHSTVSQGYNPSLYYGIPHAEMWDAIIKGEHHNFEKGMKQVNLKGFIQLYNTNALNQYPNTQKGMEAMRKLEFVFTQEIFFSTTAQYSDIVVPCTSSWEKEEGYLQDWSNNPELFIANPGIIMKPMFEAKETPWVEAELCKRLGVNPLLARNFLPKQATFERLYGAQIKRNDDPSQWERLINFTQDDINSMGAKGVPTPAGEGRISFKEFKEKGYYQISRKDGDDLVVEPHQRFVADPITNPANTDTGKLEIYCTKLVKLYNHVGFNTMNPIAKYQAPHKGYEETLTGDYPLQMICVVPMTRWFSTRYDNRHILEIHSDAVFISHVDAEKFGGIKNGDTVLISSNTGKILRRASVVTTVIPGTIVTITGASTRYNTDETIDYGGNPNSLCEDFLCGEAQVPYNSTLVKVEKWTGEPLMPEYLWADNVPNI